MRAITILLIGDNPSDVRLIRKMLKDISHFKSNLISVVTLKEGCEQIQKNNFDIILLDLKPDSTGRQTFQKVIDCSKEIPVILITGIEDEKLALKLIMEGAQDYITKQSLNSDLLGKSILYSIERQALLRNIKKQNVQIGRIEKERILLAKIPSGNPAPILRVAGNGKLLYINEAGIKLLPDWQLIINKIIPSGLKDIIDPIFIEGTTIEFELCHRELIYSFYAVQFIEEGYINLYGRDITERKRAEEALRESEEKHRTILQTSMYGFWLVDMQGRLLEVNETYCRMSGYSAQELLTLRISDLEAAEAPAYTTAHIQKIKSQGEDRFESRHRRKDGSIFDIEARVQYQFVEDGRFVVFIQDISERKRMEEALVKLKKAIYTSGEAIFLTDREGVFTFVNPAFTSLYGFSSDELIGKTTPRIINSGVLDKSIYKDFWQTLLNGNEVRGERINKRKDGTLMNIDGSATPIIDEEKKIIGFLGIQRNITERKRAEEELTEKEFFLRESQRGGNIGSYKTNFVTGYWQSSETLESIFGIDKNYDRSIAGWLEIVHPDDRQNIDEYLCLEVKGKRKSFNKEYRIVRNDNKQTRWVYGYGNVKFDDSGNITEMIGTIQDITGQKKAEENLKQSEKRFRAMIEKGNEMITLSAHDGELIYGSPSINRVLGYPLEEFLHKRAYDFIYPDDIPGLIENTKEISQTQGKSFYSQLRLLHKNGNWIWCEATLTNMLHEPGINALVSNFRDISEKKIREQQREFDSNNLNALINNTNDLMWSVDKDFKLITSNQPFDEIIGFMTGKAIAKGNNVLLTEFSQEQFTRHKKFYERAFAGETFTEIEYTVTPVETWSEISYYPIRKGDEIIGTACHSRNITERKRVEENLKQSRSRLKEAQAIAQLGSWELNFTTNVVLWSDEACRIYGFSPEENKQTYSSWVSFIHPEDLDYVMTATNESQKTLSDTVLNHRIILKDGTIKHIYSEARFEFDRNGKPVGLYGIVHDVTERKEAEIDLKASEYKFRTLIQNNTDAIMVLNENGEVIFASDSLYRIMGYNADEIIGVNTLNFIYSEDLPALEKHFKKVLKNQGKSLDITYRRVKKDGTIIWCEGTALNLLHDPIIQGIVINFRNITERKEAEEQIRQSETHLTEAQRLAKMGSWNYDIKADKLTWSEELYNVFNTDKQTFIETYSSFLHLIDAEDREFVLQTSRHTQETGEAFTLEYHITTPKGEKRVILEHGYGQKDDNGKIIRLFGTARDITEQVLSQIEKEKIMADIVQRNKDLEQFSYIVSHNLRAPVANIIGFSAIVQDENLEPDMKKEVMDGLSHSVKRLDDVIIDLNNILQTRQGLSQNKEMVHFSKIANNIHTSIENLIKKEKAVLVWDFSEVDEMITIKSYLHSIFYNLIFNSLKYRQPGIPPVIVIKSRKLKDKTELLFKDNGMGIDLEKVGDQVFGLYKRFHTKSSEGKGMGLYMVKTQVETIGGKISISSEVNKGTEFKIEFEI